MATVVGILDRDAWSANTDVIVIADPAARRLTWVPRDLWCPSLRNRVNAAFAVGGTARLIEALRELGFQCDHALVVRRRATEAAAARASIDVPVTEPLGFLYPLTPTSPIEEGSKAVSFRPPFERLEGERIHQWVGARKGLGRPASDSHRIRRQQVFLRALLNQGFDFRLVVQDSSLFQSSGAAAVGELRQIDAAWEMMRFDHVRRKTIDGKMVLVKDYEQPRRLKRRPELAAVVLTCGTPRTAVAAVRSLLRQKPSVEVVLVNSGGCGMGRLLARHGIDVAVIEREERLSTDAARTVGIAATRAPYLAFLPADFLAAPGWARKRLMAHHAGNISAGRDVFPCAFRCPREKAGYAATWLRRLIGMPHRRMWGKSYDRTMLEKCGSFREKV